MKLLSLFKYLTLHPKNAEELKGLILQFAVEGKLTESWRIKNPEIVPASLLLENFTNEKLQLVQDKVIKKEKALPVLSEEDKPFDLPSSWEWVQMINSIHLVTKGATPTSYGYQFLEEGINFIKIECVKEGEIKPHLIDCFISDEADANQKRSRLVKGDLLFSIAGTIGETAIVKASDLPANTNQALAIIRGSQTVYNPIYLQVLLDSFVTKSTRDKARGAAMNNISLGDLKEMLVPVPSKEEQKAIVEIVNQLFIEVEQLEELTKERISLKQDFVTSALRRLTETDNTTQEWNYLQQHFSSFFTKKKNIKSLRETILQLAVQGKLTAKWREENASVEHASELLKRIKVEKQQLIAEKKIKKEKPLPQIEDEDKPYDLPESWVWCRLGEIVSLKSGTTFNKALELDSGDYMYVKVGGMNLPGNEDIITTSNLYVNSDAKIDKALIPEKSIIFPKRGGAIATNKKRIVREPILVDLNTMAITSPNEFNFMYLRHWFSSIDLWELNNGTSVPQINNKDIAPLMFSIPPLREQQAIVEKVNSLISLCDKLEQEVDNSQTQIEQLMQSCLKEVFEQESN